MADGINKFFNGVWAKVIAILITGLFTVVSGYGVYHLNKLDDLVREIQADKIEMIQMINDIDDVRHYEPSSPEQKHLGLQVRMVSAFGKR